MDKNLKPGWWGLVSCAQLEIDGGSVVTEVVGLIVMAMWSLWLWCGSWCWWWCIISVVVVAVIIVVLAVIVVVVVVVVAVVTVTHGGGH